ncbi:MAG: sigma-E factor negative regulatory protein [Gammaproteobacteria bacterium]|nr:sigma-E factor negative regulatory protein [Gammaproteobacteria bacterium]MCP4088801.1 sigma-E factor negative regulatory protein [Gammaproteobacteria bacterium]MCP4275900.1 sigma-E factor negative regulatory protein [Gammaproteobacteria bacterium]MCP4832116.1 sigma-E factor negative regulatory protein [Gammaproteobacteria bacterium]MCP4928283.1 sigma-E factor negative regulatory protein [Gammaproteobacteria bacterium]
MEADVTRNIEEQLSAFLDGELPDAELELLVRRLERDQELRSTLARYSAIGGILRKENVTLTNAAFRSRVMRAISEESIAPEGSTGVQPVRAASKWRVGSMLAAAVTAFTVIGVYQLDAPVDLVQADLEVAAVLDKPLSSVNSPSVSTDQKSKENSERMTSYLVSHGEFSRSLQGTMVDSRVFIQQARFEE